MHFHASSRSHATWDEILHVELCLSSRSAAARLNPPQIAHGDTGRRRVEAWSRAASLPRCSGLGRERGGRGKNEERKWSNAK